MIISASRRTDIPAFYSEWFINRLKAGFVIIPNPYNPHQLGRVNLSIDNVDCIVFWTKNPSPMLDKLEYIEKECYPFYFQFTLNPYGQRIERNLPLKTELIKTFIKLSNHIGKERVVWRYDPIFIDEYHTVNWHEEQFKALCDALHPYTRGCVISFIDSYKNIEKNFREVTHDEMTDIALKFSFIANKYNLKLSTCAEEIDLISYGISKGACIDQKLIEEIMGCKIIAKKDVSGRKFCNCIKSIDIGVYNTCVNGCTYCYATKRPKQSEKLFVNHDKDAPMITGYPLDLSKIADWTLPSCKSNELFLF